MALFQHAPVQHAPVLEFGKTEVLRHCVALQFASIWEHLNEFSSGHFQKSAAGAAEVTDNETAITCNCSSTHGQAWISSLYRFTSFTLSQTKRREK
jgi:hypothetical protein